MKSESSGIFRSASEIALSEKRLASTWEKNIAAIPEARNEAFCAADSARSTAQRGRGRRTVGPQLVAYNERAESVGSLIAIFTASSNYWVNTRNLRVNIYPFEKKRKKKRKF